MKRRWIACLGTALPLLGVVPALSAQDTLGWHQGDRLRVSYACEYIGSSLTCGPARQIEGTLASLAGDTLVLDSHTQRHLFPLSNLSRIDRMTAASPERWERVWPMSMNASAARRRAVQPAPLATRYRLTYCDPDTAGQARPANGACASVHMAVGLIDDLRSDTLVLRGDQALGPLRVPARTVMRVDRRHRGPAVRDGVAAGLLLGAVVGTGIAARPRPDNPDRPFDFGAGWTGGLAGGLVGAMVGAAAGSLISVERWEKVDLPASPPQRAQRAARWVRLRIAIAL